MKIVLWVRIMDDRDDDLSSKEDDAVIGMLLALCQYIIVNAAMLVFIWWLIKPLFK